MLRRISFKNFVHFNEKAVIDLHGGSKETNALNIFVGANHCGKSTVCELIRRCMTENINVTQTRLFDKKSVAYVFCDFTLDSNIEIITGMIHYPGENYPCKIFLFKNESETFVRVKRPEEELITVKDPLKDHGGMVYFTKLIFGKHEKTKENEFTTILRNIVHKGGESSEERLPEKPDWESIEERYIATIPQRGIGIVQWTRSKVIGKEENYKLACERAEIISTLLNSNEINKEKEKEIFNYITFPHKFEFIEKEDKTIWVCRTNDMTEEFPLLKTSEGVLEAKVTSLLLALDKIDTLCLEEPDKNMHPQMIQRLKTVLNLESFQRTIIVVTHSPFFVDTLTIKKTHVFFQSKNESQSYTCSVTNAGKSKDLSLVADIETLRTLLFATKVLLVEGPTDREVLEAFFTHEKKSMNPEIASESKISKQLEASDPKDFTTYQIIPIGSCENAKKVRSFCKFINLPCLCLLDLDKYVKVESNSIKGFDSIPDEEYQNQLKEKYVNNDLSTFIEEEFDELSKNIQTKTKTFVWKGCLEDAILSSSENEIAKSLRIRFTENMDEKQKNKTLKKKLKQQLTQDEREKLCSLMKNVPEIQRFLKFMENMENERLKKAN